MNGAGQKPPKGEFLIEQRTRRAGRVTAEDRIMQAALKRDGYRCRNQRCEFKKHRLPVDPCHAFQHRGMGGDPSGERTDSTRKIVALCRGCHGLLDTGKLEIEPLTVAWCDGLCAFYKTSPGGSTQHLFTETHLVGSTRSHIR